MRFAAVIALASALGFAAAQSATPVPTPSNDKCNAQNIVDACVEGIMVQVEACKANDWMCLCDNYSSLLTCYNNCPESNMRPPVQNQVTQYCAAAAPLSSASIASVASVLKTAGTQAPTSASATASQTSGASGTPVDAAAFTASPTGAAGSIAAPAAGAMAIFLGLAGLL